MAGIAVEVMPEAGAPQVGITVDGLDQASVSLVTVEVSWDGGETWRPLRGATRVPMTGAGFLRDHVAPLNTPALYRLTVVGPVTPSTVVAAITVPSPTAWVQDPLAPRVAFPVSASVMDAFGSVVLVAGSLSEATYAQQVDVAVPEGADLPVASVGRRLRAAGVALTLAYAVTASADALRRLLATAGQLVVRGLPVADLLDPVAYVTVADVTEARMGTLRQVAVWSLTARQVRPTALGIVVPWWTYDQVKAAWAGSTYDQAKASRPGATYTQWAAHPTRP